MSKLPSVFNAKDHSGRMGINVIPEGWYKIMFTKSEMKKNKSSEGQHLFMAAKVTEGQHKGSVLFARLNLINKNEIAVQIAQNELGTICDAVGKTKVEDSTELHGIEFWADVRIEKGEGSNPDSNRIVMYAKEKPKAAGAAAVKKPFAA